MSISPSAEMENRPNNGGPQPHEDLSIAEHLESMRVRDEHRPNEVCFVDPHGQSRWLSETKVKQFIANHGAEHPSDFRASQGTAWETLFFHPFNESS